MDVEHQKIICFFFFIKRCLIIFYEWNATRGGNFLCSYRLKCCCWCFFIVARAPSPSNIRLFIYTITEPTPLFTVFFFISLKTKQKFRRASPGCVNILRLSFIYLFSFFSLQFSSIHLLLLLLFYQTTFYCPSKYCNINFRRSRGIAGAATLHGWTQIWIWWWFWNRFFLSISAPSLFSQCLDYMKIVNLCQIPIKC